MNNIYVYIFHSNLYCGNIKRGVQKDNFYVNYEKGIYVFCNECMNDKDMDNCEDKIKEYKESHPE